MHVSMSIQQGAFHGMSRLFAFGFLNSLKFYAQNVVKTSHLLSQIVMIPTDH